MNRTIKFRALDTQGKWRIGSLISDKTKGIAIIQQRENPISNGCATGWCFPVQEGTEGQYTGLKDKNGKEIYEGDIYKLMEVVGYNDDDEPIYNAKYQVVEYSEGVCSVGFQFLSHHTNCEVIGNIHENPELLQ